MISVRVDSIISGAPGVLFEKLVCHSSPSQAWQDARNGHDGQFMGLGAG